jgi:hypothetical protein
MSPEPVTWAPTVADVAAHIRARTKDAGGNEVGTFDANTRPTGDQVELLIENALRCVQTQIGIDPCTERLQEEAGAATALYAAMLVEVSYFPEQTSASGSSFNSLKALFDPQMKALDQEVARECGGSAEGEGGAGAVNVLTPAAYSDEREVIGPNSPEL